MQALGKYMECQKISCISNTIEKYMTFGVGQLQFINSLQFNSESLDKLLSNISPEDLLITGKGSTNVENYNGAKMFTFLSMLIDLIDSIKHSCHPRNYSTQI